MTKEFKETVVKFLEKPILWTPYDFPEDMNDSDILYTLEIEGGNLYNDLEIAKDIINKLLNEIKA